MRKEYDFSEGHKNPFAAKMKREGYSVTIASEDGTESNRFYPPGTRPRRGKPVHVYFLRRRWIVRTEGSTRAYRLTTSQDKAIEIGRKLAENRRTDLVVHAA